MSRAACDIAVLTMKRFLADPGGEWYAAQAAREDACVVDALGRAGLRAIRLDWADPAVDWSRIPAALFRTTWDYFHRFGEFAPWLERVAGQARLFNDAALVRWNMDKHYLRDLDRAGCRVVPTVYLERGDPHPLARHVADAGFAECILKPAVSGGARHTYRFMAEQSARHEALFRSLIAAEAMMLQPFVASVPSEGETSLILIDGGCTHAIRKRPKAGDFRVQDDFGGTVHPHEPTLAERDLARRAIAACPGDALYARVDLVRGASGDPEIMELELIEPELFFRFGPHAADRLAEGIARRLG